MSEYRRNAGITALPDYGRIEVEKQTSRGRFELLRAIKTL